MAVSRAAIVDENLIRMLERWDGPSVAPAHLDAPLHAGTRLSGRLFLGLLEAGFQSRMLDLEARALKARGAGYYTISSTGHEGNAAVAAALRADDPAFLHYRSGAFVAQRASMVNGQTPIFDILLSLCAAADDPISGGRHKVFGSKSLWIPPQTSTIASHLPKAMGAAMALGRARRIGVETGIPDDAVIVCSFGDASANHSTAVGAINAAAWAHYQNLPMPVLFICEDNGLGISVRTPTGWIENNWSGRPDLRYFKADGLDLANAYDVATAAVAHCRRRRAPTFLHLRTVRLLGHAGSDVETAYRERHEIEAVEASDPLVLSCRTAIERGLASPAQLLESYQQIRARVVAASREAASRAPLRSAAEVMRPLAPYRPDLVRQEAEGADFHDARIAHFGAAEALPENSSKRRHMAMLINWALHDQMLKVPESILFGEDVARKGGVYHVTTGLAPKFGVGRVFNTLLDEQSILGLAIGAAHLGFVPLPEIQYLAYYHNAADQIRGEASSLQFFSNDQFRNPMVVRVASWGYQRGFGGHFHNDNSIAALRDVPGVVIACPSRGDDAVGMLRTCMALARVDGRVVFFLEPIALYMTKDLHEEKDDAWQFRYPAPGTATPFGKARVYADGDDADLTIVSWANGLWRSLRAASTLAHDHGIGARVVDLRWLQPLDAETLAAEAAATGRVLVVDEGRKTGGLSEAIFTQLVESLGDQVALARYCGEDTFIPTGPAWEQVLPDEAGIVRAALELAGRTSPGNAGDSA